MFDSIIYSRYIICTGTAGVVPGNNTVYLNYYACVFYSKTKAPLILKGGKFMKIVVFRMPKMFRGFFKKIFNMD